MSFALGGLSGQARLLKLAEIRALEDAANRLRADYADPCTHADYIPGLKLAITLLRQDAQRLNDELNA